MEDESREARIFRGEILRSWATDSPLDARKAITVTMLRCMSWLIKVVI
jgi:hypothetical protein